MIAGYLVVTSNRTPGAGIRPVVICKEDRHRQVPVPPCIVGLTGDRRGEVAEVPFGHAPDEPLHRGEDDLHVPPTVGIVSLPISPGEFMVEFRKAERDTYIGQLRAVPVEAVEQDDPAPA